MKGFTRFLTGAFLLYALCFGVYFFLFLPLLQNLLLIILPRGITGQSFFVLLPICIGIFPSYTILRSLQRRLIQATVMDNPNARSMHTTPVPRGGGWIFVLAAAAMLALYAAFIGWPMDEFDEDACSALDRGRTCYLVSKAWLPLTLLGGLGLLAIISRRDDRQGVAARWRLLTQIAAVVATFGIYWWTKFGVFDPAALFTYAYPSWLGGLALAAMTVGWVGFINFYNFMDGIDGISAVETLSIAGFFLLLPILGVGQQEFMLLYGIAIALCGASLSFLRLNWHPAKIFLGDVGSVTIGYLLGLGLIMLAVNGFWTVALTLPLYYLADGGITLLRRLFKGEKIWEAHKTHFYQRAAQAAGRHDVVVLKIAACNAVLTLIAALELFASPWFVLAAPLPVAALLHNMAHQRHIGPKLTR